MKPIRAVTTPADRLLAICGKCGRKLGGGFGPGGRQRLGKALARDLGLPKPKRARLRIVETKCLKLCPKQAVALADSAQPGVLLVVPAGLATTDIIAALGLDQRGRAERATPRTSSAMPSGSSTQTEPR